MLQIIGHAKGTLDIPGYDGAKYLSGYNFQDPHIAEIARVADLLKAVMALNYLAPATADAMLAAITGTGLFMSIHSASPGTTGANELIGGTAYTGTRPAIAWAASANGAVTSSDTQTYAMLVTESGGIPYFGLWTAASAGTYLTGGPTSGLSGSIPSGANVIFTSAVTLTVSG